MSESLRSINRDGIKDSLLDELLDEIGSRVQAGEPVDLEAYVQAHPEYADQLRQLLPAMRVMARLGASGASVPPCEPDSDEIAGVLGDFRIIREIGRGGMGVVYEAEQISLRRRVALKILPFAGALDARRLQRFQNEAQAAASLHHTHIVPVFGIGCERAVHFYAMQYIEGQSLAAIIRELRLNTGLGGEDEDEPVASPAQRKEAAQPVDEQAATAPYVPHTAAPVPLPADTTPRAGLSTEKSIQTRQYFRTVAELGIQAAQALDHAHETGVVHRDIKPANLMIDSHGKLWITDFGLAQCQQQAGLTMTGDLIGTLRYMSPEQALAQRAGIDHRTDIYSLGATLYERLALRPVFAGENRQELLRQIAFEEPKRLRSINKAIPAELETIVLKALEKNPADRYGTARELAEDLERFAKEEPIRARPPTWRQRGMKWIRRHPGIAGTSLVGAGLLLLVVLAGLWMNNRMIRQEQEQTRQERDRAEAAANAEKNAKETAQAREAETEAVLDFVQNHIFAAARPEGQDGGLGREVTLRRAVTSALPWVGRSFPEKPLIEARLRDTLGVSFLYLGEPGVAEQQFQKVYALCTNHFGPDDPQTLKSMHNLAISYSDLGRYKEALELQKKILALRKAKFGPEHRDTLSAMNNLAYTYADLGRHGEAAKLREEVLEVLTAEFGPDHPDTLRGMSNLADS
jgi:eukaryotic-like serine/threonine-protein kinase